MHADYLAELAKPQSKTKQPRSAIAPDRHVLRQRGKLRDVGGRALCFQISLSILDYVFRQCVTGAGILLDRRTIAMQPQRAPPYGSITIATTTGTVLTPHRSTTTARTTRTARTAGASSAGATGSLVFGGSGGPLTTANNQSIILEGGTAKHRAGQTNSCQHTSRRRARGRNHQSSARRCRRVMLALSLSLVAAVVGSHLARIGIMRSWPP